MAMTTATHHFAGRGETLVIATTEPQTFSYSNSCLKKGFPGLGDSVGALSLHQKCVGAHTGGNP